MGTEIDLGGFVAVDRNGRKDPQGENGSAGQVETTAPYATLTTVVPQAEVIREIGELKDALEQVEFACKNAGIKELESLGASSISEILKELDSEEEITPATEEELRDKISKLIAGKSQLIINAADALVLLSEGTKDDDRVIFYEQQDYDSLYVNLSRWIADVPDALPVNQFLSEL